MGQRVLIIFTSLALSTLLNSGCYQLVAGKAGRAMIQKQLCFSSTRLACRVSAYMLFSVSQLSTALVHSASFEATPVSPSVLVPRSPLYKPTSRSQIAIPKLYESPTLRLFQFIQVRLLNPLALVLAYTEKDVLINTTRRRIYCLNDSLFELQQQNLFIHLSTGFQLEFVLHKEKQHSKINGWNLHVWCKSKATRFTLVVTRPISLSSAS